MLVVPENVQLGSPPFLKCGLAANATVVVSATAVMTPTRTNKIRLMRLVLLTRFCTVRPPPCGAGFHLRLGCQSPVSGRRGWTPTARHGRTGTAIGDPGEHRVGSCKFLRLLHMTRGSRRATATANPRGSLRSP